MTEKQFREQTMYETTMHLVRRLLQEGIITQEEYAIIDTKFREKYNPLFGRL